MDIDYKKNIENRLAKYTDKEIAEAEDKFVKYAFDKPVKLTKFEKLLLMELLSEKLPNSNIKKELKEWEKLKDKLSKP